MKQSFEPDHAPEIADLVYIPPDGSWFFPLHSHPDELEISFILSGSSNYYYNGFKYRLERFQIAVKEPGIVHSEISDSKDPVEQLCLALRGVHFSGCPANCFLNRPEGMVLESGEYGPLLKELFLLLQKKYRSGEKCAGLVEGILQILGRLKEEDCLILPEKRKTRALIEDVKTYINCHFDSKLSLESIAALFFMSKYHLERQFKACTSYTINHYLTDVRMGEAQRLLIYEDLPMKEIAEKCGFSDVHYFYSVFKKYTGMTPQNFRAHYAP